MTAAEVGLVVTSDLQTRPLGRGIRWRLGVGLATSPTQGALSTVGDTVPYGSPLDPAPAPGLGGGCSGWRVAFPCLAQKPSVQSESGSTNVTLLSPVRVESNPSNCASSAGPRKSVAPVSALTHGSSIGLPRDGS